MLNSSKNILFIYPQFSTFVKTDYEMLCKRYSVKKYLYLQSKSLISNLLNQIKLLFWMIGNIANSHCTYIWFADYHALVPIFISKLFRKKSFLVLAGYDVTYIKEIDYGSFKNPVRAFCARYAIKNATVNMADADNIAEEAKLIVDIARVDVVYNGSDPEKFFPADVKKENVVLTVAGGDTLQRFRLKGIDFFAKMAEIFPELKFIVAGGMTSSVTEFLEKTPSNLTF